MIPTYGPSDHSGPCTFETASKIVALLLADSSVCSLSVNAEKIKAGRRADRPAEALAPHLLGVSLEEGQAAVALADRVRAAAIEKFDTVTAAERGLGLYSSSLNKALRLDRVRLKSQLRILRGAASMLGVAL